MSSIVFLVAGGDPVSWPTIEPKKMSVVAWIGVDRGALYLHQAHLPVTKAIGDFDSLSAAERQLIHQTAQSVEQLPTEKDDTDLQAALLTATQEYPTAEFVILGATGGRLDHFLVNLWIPLEQRFQPFLSQIILADRQNTVRYYRPGYHQISKEAGKDYLAFVCLTAVEDLSLLATKYELTKQCVTVPTSFSSNEFLGEQAAFSFSSGVVAVVQSCDETKNSP